MGEGLLRLKLRQQVGEYAFRIYQHVRIPVSNDTKSFRPQASIPHSVSLRVDMLPAVDLDYQSSFETDEVQDVRSERCLPPELDAVQSSVAQQEPELPLDLSRDPAHGTRILALLRPHELVMRYVWHETPHRTVSVDTSE
jgi:hypothetical protein